MDDGSDPIEQIAFLARSESRVRVLEALQNEGSASQRTLRDRLEMSRSTLSRSLQTLEDREWVAESNDGYHLSPIGKVIAEEFLDLVERVSVAEDVAPFLHWFPFGESDLDLAHLADAEVTTITEGDPYAPVRRNLDVLETADDVRAFVPVTNLEGYRVVHEPVLEGSMEIELILTPPVEATVESEEYADLFVPLVESGGLQVQVLEDEYPSYYIGLSDGELVQLGITDDEGVPRALLETTADPVWEWAEKRYETLRDRASVKPLEDF
jgi:predicted transcriptional regulator